jgi:hypothetical protein
MTRIETQIVSIISTLIKGKMTERGLKKKNLATITKLSLYQLNCVLSGQTNIPFENYMRVLTALGIDLFRTKNYAENYIASPMRTYIFEK